MSYFQECLKKFDDLPADFKNKVGSLEVFERIEAIEEVYGIDLKFLVILIAIGEVSLKDIPEYLQAKYKLAEEDAYEIRDRLIKEVFKLTADFPKLEVELETEPDNILLKSESEIKKIFHEELVAVLKGNIVGNSWNIEDLNEAIFFWLSQDGDLQDELNKTFLNNQERLTSERLMLEDREVAPTITNWLKDFIKINGSEIFDELALAQYLTNAPNAKILGPVEKDLIRKLLKLYHNLSFFPESMGNLAVEDWQIIPFDRVVGKKQEFRDVLNEAKPILKNELADRKEKETTPLAELEQTLSEYTPGNLEYKAVAQEIERLKKKK